MPEHHVVLIHPDLGFSGRTERMIATAGALRAAGARVTVVTQRGSRTAALEAAGVEARFVELPLEPWQSPFRLARTRAAVAQLRPDSLHVTDQVLAGLGAALARLLRRPYAIEFLRAVSGPVPLHAALCTRAIVASEPLAEGLVNRGRVPREKVSVVHHAPVPVEPRATPDLWDGVPFAHGQRPRVGCSGHLDAANGTDWFLEAARLLVLGGQPCVFGVLGEGPQEHALRRRARELGIAEHVTVGVPTTLRSADSLGALDVHVATRWDCGPGWLAQEAMVQGVPAVLAAVGNAYEMIEDKRSGVLVEAGNARRLADEIASLIVNGEVARRMGRTGRERVLELHPREEFERAVAEVHLGNAVRA